MKTGIHIQNISKKYEKDLLYEKPGNSDYLDYWDCLSSKFV